MLGKKMVFHQELGTRQDDVPWCSQNKYILFMYVCLYTYVCFVLCIVLQFDLGSEMGNGQSQISSLDIFNKIAIS